MRTLVAILMMALPLAALAQQLVPGQSHTIDWEPAVVVSGSTQYEVVVENLDTSSVTVVGRTDLTSYTFDVPEGNWRVGVTTVRIAPDSTEVRSGVNWGDEDLPIGATPVPFVLQWWEPPEPVRGLRLR